MRDKYGDYHCNWCGDNLARGIYAYCSPECLDDDLKDARARGKTERINKLRSLRTYRGRPSVRSRIKIDRYGKYILPTPNHQERR